MLHDLDDDASTGHHHRSPTDFTRPSAATAAFQALTTGVRRCQDAGAAHAPDDPAHLAAQIWATLHGLALLRLNAPHFPWPASIEEMVTQAVSRLLVLDDGPP